MENRILESDLQLPALLFISLNNGKITTSQLSENLRDLFKLSEADLRILSGRTDDYFSQIVRNLTGATRPFVQNGYIRRDADRNSPLFITDKGEAYLNENYDALRISLENSFNSCDLTNSLREIETNQNKRIIEIFDENSIIQEGTKKLLHTTVYERSSKLRNYAIQYYTENHRISCHCCNFNFHDFYGEALGKDFIEIHHTKPIFKYEDDDLESTLERAVQNLTPVCSNCHSIMHRNRTKLLDIQTLIDSINANGVFRKAI